MFSLSSTVCRWSGKLRGKPAPASRTCIDSRPRRQVMSSATDPAQAILAMVNWLGLIVMPIMAALFLAVGVYKYSKGESMERCVIGVMVAISISGITRLAEYFVATSAGNSVVTDTYSNALLNLTNWVANVILPVYAAIEVVRAGISFEDLSTMRTDLRPVKHFATAMMCCAVSAIMGLIEYRDAQGQQVGS